LQALFTILPAAVNKSNQFCFSFSVLWALKLGIVVPYLHNSSNNSFGLAIGSPFFMIKKLKHAGHCYLTMKDYEHLKPCLACLPIGRRNAIQACPVRQKSINLLFLI